VAPPFNKKESLKMYFDLQLQIILSKMIIHIISIQDIKKKLVLPRVNKELRKKTFRFQGTKDYK
jgi:hypothetical protein